jgi:hypothetical protein
MALGSQPISAPAHIPCLRLHGLGFSPTKHSPNYQMHPHFPLRDLIDRSACRTLRTGRSRSRRSGRLVVRRCWTAGLPVAWPCACGLRPLRRARRRCSPQLPMLAAGGETWNWVRSGPQGHGTAASAPAHGAVAVESRPSGVWLFDAHCHLQDPRIVKKMSGTPLGSLPAN